MINQLLQFGLFKRPKSDHGKINRCTTIDVTPIDLQLFQNNLLFLADNGIYDEKQSLLYSQNNSYAMFANENYLYLAHDNNIDILSNWNIIKTILLPKGLIIYDFIVVHNNVYITIDYQVSDLLGFYFQSKSFSLLKCDFEGNCEFVYEISGVHLSGIEWFNDKIYIADTFSKTLNVYDMNYNQLQTFQLEDGPKRIIRIVDKLYFTAIPKLLELLTLPKFTSLYQYDDIEELQKLVTFENFYYVGVHYKEEIIMGNRICF
ncbi:unnamed protein product (macronuclear) [Paramecium tetraurelia]|uniref:SMP-30/Gluconolactonase/LRE-like region domain-containing protein n=1 Tax=Paramecium tetraurelia TaxID=5888 RepID=A0BBY7_PARTE|nr:uncharacterized protein GSPATT00000490001 [Paramecium tetraurelia]CAK56054.1 unnamed protein product [Paramecium tetraurelia]|eukprot:XP_001423452.1 hypothetical protein (macronuclear) [Paramecium tetraurelia strain d4-2]